MPMVIYLLCLNQIPTAPDLILLWMSSIRRQSIVCSLYCRYHLDGGFKFFWDGSMAVRLDCMELRRRFLSFFAFVRSIMYHVCKK